LDLDSYSRFIPFFNVSLLWQNNFGLDGMKLRYSLADLLSIRIGCIGILVVSGTIAAMATLLGFLGPSHWFLDLFSHFRVQYCAGLGLVALLLAVSRQYRLSAIFGFFAMINLALIMPFYFGKADVPPFSGNPIRLMLANVNNSSGNPETVNLAIQSIKPDILVLEEVNAHWLLKLNPSLTNYAYSQTEPREDNFGIALYSRFPLTNAQIVFIGDAEVPSVFAEIATPQGICAVLATHPPPPGGSELSQLRNGQLAELPSWTRRTSQPILLAGDLNVTPWNPYFKRLLRNSGLSNSMQGRGIQTSWPTSFPPLRIPLDHCLHSPEIKIVQRTIGPHVGSDHFPLIVDFIIRK
jgi:endonuclease/exonuclease/phosphatase (EEP) superfamily protein YafD